MVMQKLTPHGLPNNWKVHKVGADCELRQYITRTVGAEFKRGHAYYEFTNDVENILEGKKVLQQDIGTECFQEYQSDKTTAVNYGRGISRNSFGENCKVFVQSFGSGARYLPEGSKILYNHSKNQVMIFLFTCSTIMYMINTT